MMKPIIVLLNGKEICRRESISEANLAIADIANDPIHGIKKGDVLEIHPDSIKEELLIRIQVVADEKWEARKEALLEYKGTNAQIQRYELLAQAAERGEYSAEENAMILAERDALKSAELRFMNMIETVRKYLNSLVENGEFEKASEQLELAKNMHADVTKKDIENFIKV